MNLIKTNKGNEELKAQFDKIVYLESLADSIDYVENENPSQQDIDDHVTVNEEFARAIATFGITPAQYYEVKEALI